MKTYLMYLSVAVLTLAASISAHAQGTHFIAILSGDDEVPANASRARGIAIFSLSDDGSTLNYKLIVANLNNPVAAHIHTGVEGVNGPVVQGLFSGTPGSGGFSGILAEGSFAATAELLEAMENGGTYVNVHTNDGVAPPNTGPGDLPGGEIRGQVFPVGDEEE
jgi:CHRD domain